MSYYKLFSNRETQDTIFQIWGGSTKHPDEVFHLSDFEKSKWYSEKSIWHIPQWIVEIAGKQNWIPETFNLTDYAKRLYKWIYDNELYLLDDD